MAYTIRTTKHDDDVIESIKSLTDTTTATKALLAAARLCLSQHDEIKRLKADLDEARRNHSAASKVVSNYQNSLKLLLDYQ